MLPVLFQIGPFKLHSWGVLLLAGFLLALWRAVANAHRYGFAKEMVWDASLIGLLGGVVGGRLLYVLQNLGDSPQGPGFLGHPLQVFAIWNGGMTSFGGFLGGVGAGLWAARRRGMKAGDAADLAAVSLPIGYGVGRIGCFLNGCCYGAACDLPWAMRFHDHGSATLTPPSHPAQLYSVAAAALIYAALAVLEPRRRFPGQLLAVFVLLYSLYRFVIEFVREGVTAETLSLSLTTGQWASILCAVAAAAFYALASRRTAR